MQLNDKQIHSTVTWMNRYESRNAWMKWSTNMWTGEIELNKLIEMKRRGKMKLTWSYAMLLEFHTHRERETQIFK